MCGNTPARYFEGKTDKIKERIDKFWSYPFTARDVGAYLSGNDLEYRFGRQDEKWMKLKPKPPFSDWDEADPKTLRVGRTAILILNRESFSVAQYGGEPERAGMSFIHIMAIPIDNLFNGVSLTPATVGIIKESIQLFEETWEDMEHRKEIVEKQVDAIKRRAEGQEKAMDQYEELREMAMNLKVDDFAFGLHLWNEQSVPHLHLHIIAMTTEMREYSTKEHDKKTVDAIELHDYIMGHPDPF
ncbi:hypothetical protein F5Y04DRAFT_283373 [Hypomontagnella monticulosa]|nr:hypothetical protein F5Y04DRAFT_283373 [Hypomontagnella monticulosa]